MDAAAHTGPRSARRRRWAAGAAILAAVLCCDRTEAEASNAWVAQAVATEAAESAQRGSPGGIGIALETAERWIAGGDARKGLELLRELLPVAQAHGADTAPVRFLMAQAMMRLRQYEEAAIVLGKLVAEQPTVDRFALDYAAALFALGRNTEARAVFRTMRSERDLPPVVRRNVERFLERIRARQPLRIDLDFGLWQDHNVNNAPERETVEVPVLGRILQFTPDEEPVSAWVARTGVRARWRKPLGASPRVSVETRASVARNSALGASEHNRTWARASSGPRLRYSKKLAGRPRSGMILGDVGAERRWRGGDGYATSLWTGVGVRQSISGDWNAGMFARLWATDYDGHDADSDPAGRSVALRARRGLGPGWLTMGVRFAREDSARRHLSWTSCKASAAYAADVGRGWNLSVRGSVGRTGFGDNHPSFRIRREDRILDASLGVSHRSLSWEGYLPELTLSWGRTTSSIPIYDRKLWKLQLGLRRMF